MGANGRAYSMEVVETAQELYCIDGMTYESVSAATGVPASTLKRWAKKYAWAAARDEFRRARLSIRENTIRLRARHLEYCLSAVDDSMAMFAAAKLQEAAIRALEAERQGRELVAPVIPARAITSMDDAASALQEAIEYRLGQMLVDPSGVDLAAIKNIRSAMQTVNDMRSSAPGDAKKSKGISEETVSSIMERILGKPTQHDHETR